jgi:hypothetical protein
MMTVLKHLRTACDLRVRFRALGDRVIHHIIQNVWDNTHEGIASKKVETSSLKNNITIPFKPQQST